MKARPVKPVTIERIEQAMDTLAETMVELGEEGIKCLPIYERLERELEVMRSQQSRMNSVLDRVKRLRDRSPAQSC